VTSSATFSSEFGHSQSISARHCAGNTHGVVQLFNGANGSQRRTRYRSYRHGG
jgi:hypothetical protein